MQFFKNTVSVDNHDGFRVFCQTLQKLEIIEVENQVILNWPMFSGLRGI
jgi:hypothetical protein